MIAKLQERIHRKILMPLALAASCVLTPALAQTNHKKETFKPQKSQQQIVKDLAKLLKGKAMVKPFLHPGAKTLFVDIAIGRNVGYPRTLSGYERGYIESSQSEVASLVKMLRNRYSLPKRFYADGVDPIEAKLLATRAKRFYNFSHDRNSLANLNSKTNEFHALLEKPTKTSKDNQRLGQLKRSIQLAEDALAWGDSTYYDAAISLVTKGYQAVPAKSTFILGEIDRSKQAIVLGFFSPAYKFSNNMPKHPGLSLVEITPYDAIYLPPVK